ITRRSRSSLSRERRSGNLNTVTADCERDVCCHRQYLPPVSSSVSARTTQRIGAYIQRRLYLVRQQTQPLSGDGPASEGRFRDTNRSCESAHQVRTARKETKHPS